MSEFKVGDRVKMTAFKRYAKIIREREIMCSNPHYLVSFEDDASECLIPEIDLEIVDKNGKTLDQQKIENLEQRIEKLEKEVFKPVEFHVRPEETKSSLLTEDERVILRNLDKNWKWIARDEDNELYIFETKPCKESYFWSSEDDYWQINCYFTNLFQFIKWNDKEPYNIEELLKGECGNE